MEVHDRVEKLLAAGMYVQTADVLFQSAKEGKSNAELSILRSTVCQLLGRLDETAAALDEAEMLAPNPGQLLHIKLLRLELVSFTAKKLGAELLSALVQSEEIISIGREQFKRGELTESKLASAICCRAKLVLVAAKYEAVSPGAVEGARRDLEEQRIILQQSGQLFAAWQARLFLVKTSSQSDDQLAALQELADQALEEQQTGIACSARLDLAKQMLHQGKDIDTHLLFLEGLVGDANGEQWPFCIQHLRALKVVDYVARVKALETCLDAFIEKGLVVGGISVVLDITSQALRAGRVQDVEEYLERSEALMSAANLGTSFTFQLSLIRINLLQQQNNFGEAMQICHQLLDDEGTLTSVQAGTCYVSLSCCYQHTGNFSAGSTAASQAVLLFTAAKQTEMLSEALRRHFDCRLRLGRDPDIIAQVSERIKVDEAQGNFEGALGGLELLILVHLDLVREPKSGDPPGDPLSDAKSALHKAEVLVQKLRGSSKSCKLGNILQLRALLAAVQQDEITADEHVCEAASLYSGASMGREAANSLFLAGIAHLNRANKEQSAKGCETEFCHAEKDLLEALQQYNQLHDLGNAANAASKLALLLNNLSVRVRQGQVQCEQSHVQIQRVALDYLEQAEHQYDAIRRQFAFGTVEDVQAAKRALSRGGVEVYQLGLSILLNLGEMDTAWDWLQRFKARALCDTMGSGSALPSDIQAALQRHPAAQNLVSQERQLAQQALLMVDERRARVLEELQGVTAQIEQLCLEEPNGALARYIALRSGAPVSASDLASLASVIGPADYPPVFVDWFVVGDDLWSSIWRVGQGASMRNLNLSMSTFVRGHVRALANGVQSILFKRPERLQVLKGLVAHLEFLTQPGELLILSPTSVLYAVPLHALHVVDEPLLMRNPCLYTPSLSVLRQCVARQVYEPESESQLVFGIIGDPQNNAESAADEIRMLAKTFNSIPILGSEATCEAFKQLSATSDILHYQGHARHDLIDPLNSSLLLAGSQLTAREVLCTLHVRASLITLAACETGAHIVESGDEPQGLVAAFLSAGANSVLASLWKVNDHSTAEFVRGFYTRIKSKTTSGFAKARALQEAVRELKSDPEFSAPYYWAAFVLFGV